MGLRRLTFDYVDMRGYLKIGSFFKSWLLFEGSSRKMSKYLVSVIVVCLGNVLLVFNNIHSTMKVLASHSTFAGNSISDHHRQLFPELAPVKKLSSCAINGRKYMQMAETDKARKSRHLRHTFKISPMAVGTNINQGVDDDFDDLFKRYGKVVYKSDDQKSPTSEADDDAECLSFAVAAAKVANDVKAADIRVLFVKPLVYWTKFFIITTAFSRPQIDAIGSRIRDLAGEKYGRVASGDIKPNSWTLLDFGDVIVHIFLPEQRTYYNLEEFYANATSIELPFESEHPFRG